MNALDELLLIAGSDCDAVALLTFAYNTAVLDEPLDLPRMSQHCADPAALAARMSMPVLCDLLVEYVKSWADETQQHWITEWEEAILGGLFLLRTGQRACVECLERQGVITNIHACRAGSSVDCEQHATARERRMEMMA
jgi:hypothetical protein